MTEEFKPVDFDTIVNPTCAIMVILTRLQETMRLTDSECISILAAAAASLSPAEREYFHTAFNSYLGKFPVQIDDESAVGNVVDFIIARNKLN